MNIQSVAVFCGSKTGNNPVFAQHAKELGKLIAMLKLKLVYGGASKGLMGILADSVLAHEGQIMGIIPEVLIEWEHQHKGLTELAIVPDMHVRKKMIFDRSDAAIVLPGGYGTLDEFFETITLVQTLKVEAFPIILYGRKFWSGLRDWMQEQLLSKYIDEEDLEIFHIVDSPQDVAKQVVAGVKKHWWAPIDDALKKAAPMTPVMIPGGPVTGAKSQDTGEGTRYGRRAKRSTKKVAAQSRKPQQ